MSSPSHGEVVRRPTTWLTAAFFGVWLYLIAAILQVYRAQVAGAFTMEPSDLSNLLGVTSWIGQTLFFAGLVAALWRSNLAAGLTGASVTGLTLGAAGIGMMCLFDLALLIRLLGVPIAPATSLLQAQDMITALGIFLGFAGLASLAVGLTQATGLFARAETPEPAASAATPATDGRTS